MSRFLLTRIQNNKAAQHRHEPDALRYRSATRPLNGRELREQLADRLAVARVRLTSRSIRHRSPAGRGCGWRLGVRHNSRPLGVVSEDGRFGEWRRLTPGR